MHPGFWIGLALGSVTLLLAWLAIERSLAAEKRRSTSPFFEKLTRPPGESLRLHIGDLQEKMFDLAVPMALFLMIPPVFIMLIKTSSLPFALMIHTPAVLLCWWFCWRRWRKFRTLRKNLRNARLGFDGERYVAAELSKLMGRGYRVFHDFLIDWVRSDRVSNIDHIVVGPAGVFAIETKARRKPTDSAGTPSSTVIFDGKRLQFPGDKPRADAIDQAKRSAKTLAEWLTGTAPESVLVRPLVVLPGWWVEAENSYTCGVQSLKGLADRLPSLQRGPGLSEREIQILGDKIEAHCQNVEGAH
jgi:hypothetical protein